MPTEGASNKQIYATTRKTDLRLRLLSDTKLVISTRRTLFEARPDGRARKRSCEGIPVPVSGSEQVTPLFLSGRGVRFFRWF